LERDSIPFSFEKLVERAREMQAMKHNLLSLLAGLFDPLGLISPMIAPMKMLFQTLCCEKRDWEKELEGESRKKFSEWVADLSKIKGISISRCVYENPKQRVLECQLHEFGDASTKAYCAVVYLVYTTNEGVNVKLLASKSRVAPIKTLTIPRLERMSARILAQLMETVKNASESQLEISPTKYWLDSKTALCWIQNREEWKQFVRHRVNEILKLTHKKDWGHCPGGENPADIGSRGMLGSRLKNEKLWWCRPKWLTQMEDEWPSTIEDMDTPESQEELKKTANAMVLRVECLPSVPNVVDINRHGNLEKLLRVTAWVFRFIRNLRPNQDKNAKRSGSLTKK